MELLSALKVDLGITTTAYDERLQAIIEASKTAITITGITLEDNAVDNQLVIMYASWLWRRRDSGDGMPRMLQYAIHQRLFSEKVKVL